jgi:hypothetical protein
MITLLNNRVKRGSSTMQYYFNGFENKAKYGAGYGYGYGYGYGPYSNGYTDEEKPRHFYDAIKKIKKKGKKK